MPATHAIFGAMAWLGLAVLCALPALASTNQPHPFLFLTSQQVEAARRVSREQAVMRNARRELERKCDQALVSELPALETSWWNEARQKKWAEIYPPIWHHTMMVPLQWAGLARDSARAWLLSGEHRHLAKAKETLLTLSKYSFEFEHYDVGLNYTVWAVAALEAYDVIYGELSSAERANMNACFARYLSAVAKNDEYWVKNEPGGKLNNHYAWHKLGLCMYGLFYNQPGLVEQAMHGPKGALFMLRHGFKDNGLWLEGSIPYQFAATSALLLMAEILENAHYPVSLFREETDDGRTLKQSYDALLSVCFPDGRLPAIGDCYGRRPHLAQHPDWEVLCRQYGDPAYAWLIRQRGERVPQALFAGAAQLPEGSAPPQSTRLWPEMGYAALRSSEGVEYWSGRGWTLFATCSSRPVHENADKLSIQLFADGHLWLPDCEMRPGAEHSFSAQVQSSLNRETLCHNTLLVDGASQRFPGRPLELVAFEDLPRVKRLSMGDLQGQLYPGVRQLRTILVCRDYVLDLFEAQAEQAHDFAWLVHIDGASVGSSMREWLPTNFPPRPPWSYLRGARREAEPSRQGYWEIFEHAGQRLRLDVLADAAMEVRRCEFPLDETNSAAHVAMRLLQRRGSQARFLALYRVTADESDGPVLRVVPGPLDTLEVNVKSAKADAVHVFPTLQGLR